MITSLFSIFDPGLRFFSFSWLIFLFVLWYTPSPYWFTNYYLFYLILYIKLVKKEMDYLLSFVIKGGYSFFRMIFFFISFFNLIAIFPFIFSVTSHLLLTLPLSYSIWLGIVSFCLLKSFQRFLAHLIPMGTPLALIRFIVIVELLSNIIRPIALTFRLTANMIAGHLLMSLVGGAVLSLRLGFMLVGSFFQSLLVTIELGVCIVQAYVFTSLLLLYLSDREH